MKKGRCEAYYVVVVANPTRLGAYSNTHAWVEAFNTGLIRCPMTFRAFLRYCRFVAEPFIIRPNMLVKASSKFRNYTSSYIYRGISRVYEVKREGFLLESFRSVYLLEISPAPQRIALCSHAQGILYVEARRRPVIKERDLKSKASM